jgi:hypothetical protein
MRLERFKPLLAQDHVIIAVPREVVSHRRSADFFAVEVNQSPRGLRGDVNDSLGTAGEEKD